MVSDQHSDDSDPPVFLKAVGCVLLSLAFVLGVPGNLAVVWTVCRRMRAPQPTVLLILNLAAADLLALLTVPVWIYVLTGAWALGSLVCRTLAWLVHGSMFSGVLSITVLSAERLVALVRPFHLQRWWRRAGARRVLLGLWVVSLALAAPAGVSVDSDNCREHRFSSSLHLAASLLLETGTGFVVPFSIIAVCSACSRSHLRRLRHPSSGRAGRTVTAVAVLFAVFWLPYHAANAMVLVADLLEASSEKLAEKLQEAASVTHLLSAPLIFLGSCVNPLLYAFASRRTARPGGLAGLFARMVPNFYSNGGPRGEKRSSENLGPGPSLDRLSPPDPHGEIQSSTLGSSRTVSQITLGEEGLKFIQDPSASRSHLEVKSSTS